MTAPAATRSFDVVVAGAGIIGSSVAWDLARRGLSVAVLESAERPGRESSAAAGGVLAPNAEAEAGSALYDLKRRSLDLFPAYVADVRDETGIDCEFRRDGLLALATTDEEERENEKREALVRAAGGKVERLSARETLAREPAVSPSVRSALFFPDEAQTESARLSEAVAVAARRKGAVFFFGRPAQRVIASGSRVVGVETPSGPIACATVVVAAGAWSRGIAGLPLDPPVKPIRGQIVVLRAPAPPLRAVLSSGEIYAVPRSDGRVLLGATVEDAGFDKSVTADGVRWLLDGGVRAVPSFGALAIETSWAGLRPEAADHLPIVGRTPGLDGLVLATGHFRAGIVLAPLTMRAVGDLVAEGKETAGLECCSPARFAR